MSAVAETVRQKGPRVWLDMDQKELDDAYDQAVYAPNSEQVALRRRHRVSGQPTGCERRDVVLGHRENVAWRLGGDDGLGTLRGV